MHVCLCCVTAEEWVGPKQGYRNVKIHCDKQNDQIMIKDNL